MSTDLASPPGSTLAVDLLQPKQATFPVARHPCDEELTRQEVETGLAAYLRDHLGVSRVQFASPPAALSDGWETYTYRFQLRGEIPVRWQGPMILRVHVGRYGVPRVRHEVAVQRFLVEAGYPVPEVLLHEDRYDLLGGPFLIMNEVPGRMLLETLLHAPWRMVTTPGKMAEVHARLHDLPAAGFPEPEEQFLGNDFGGIGALVERYGLTGLRPGLDWLRKNQPAPPATPSIVHLDFHPLNILSLNRDGSYVVIDWTYADVGDPHADVATTLMLMECVPVRGQSWLNRFATSLGRPLLCRAYLREYAKRRSIDPERLAYYRAWAALRRLAIYGRWIKAGPAASGCKAGLVARLEPAHRAGLERYFQTWSGVDVHL